MPSTREIIIPNGIVLKNGDFLPFKLVDRLIDDHTWGKGLATFARFDPFRPPHLTETEWGLLLGPHGNNLDHNSAARQGLIDLTAAVKKRPQFNPSLTTLLAINSGPLSEVAFGASFHDLAEYYIGDYPMGTKPATVREVEFVIMRKMAEQIFVPAIGKSNAEDAVDRAVAMLENKKHPITQFFKTSEEVGHVEAGMQALFSSRRDIDPLSQTHLRWMGSKVFTDLMTNLLELSYHQPHADDLLVNNQSIFHTVFEDTPDWVLRFYPDQIKQTKVFTAFTEASDKWHDYCQKRKFSLPQRPKFVFSTNSQTISAQPVLV